MSDGIDLRFRRSNQTFGTSLSFENDILSLLNNRGDVLSSVNINLIKKEKLPTANEDNLGVIYLYTGPDGEHQHGYFYECVENSGVYSWENIIVQDSYLKSESDNRFVHKTGDETIDGEKTWNENAHFEKNISTVGDIILENEENERHIKFKKSNDDAIRGLITNRYIPNSLVTLGFSSLYNTGKSAQMTMIAGENIKSDISVFAEQNDRATGETDIHKRTVATQGWVNNPEKSLNVVHRSGDEFIDGKKSFNDNIALRMGNFSKGTIPSSSIYKSLAIESNDEASDYKVNRLAILESQVFADNKIQLSIIAYKNQQGSGDTCRISVGYDTANNKAYTYCSNPNSSANGNEIATCSWVKNLFDAQANSSYVTGWFKYNGLKICYAQPGQGFSSGQFVTTPITFSSSKWVVIPIHHGTNANINVTINNDGQTTGFYIYHNYSNPISIMYIAIGY